MKDKLPVLFAVLLFGSMSAGSGHAGETFTQWLLSWKRMKETAPVSDEVYKDECGACHFPYPPGLLPGASWQRLLEPSALSDHFGDDAELDEQTRRHVLAYVLANAAEKSYYKRSRKVMASLRVTDSPQRITEVPYIRERHRKIPASLIKGNPKVKSLSNCDACHQRAAVGVFDDDTVMIPGKGYWNW